MISYIYYHHYGRGILGARQLYCCPEGHREDDNKQENSDRSYDIVPNSFGKLRGAGAERRHCGGGGGAMIEDEQL